MVYDFGLRLRNLRIERGLSQPQVADILGLSKNSVYNYENNITLPSIDSLKAFAIFYRVTTDYLLGLENRKKIVLDLESPDNEIIVERMVELLQNELNKK